jgi:lipoprotein-releasing system ATP-binding protein
MPSEILELEGVTKEYGEPGAPRTRVLHGIDLALVPGEFTALIGPSGSGKSTLLNIIGLLDRPTSGRVVVGGQDASHLDDTALTRLRGRTIGFVFQFHHLLPAFTAVENVILPVIADRGRASAAIIAHGRALLDAVGLGARAETPAGRLSGGQQQRVAVARALALEPRLVLADEPTGNLDSASADEVFALLRGLARDRGIGFLVVTHDSRIAARAARVLELVDGRVVGDRRQPAAH